MNSVVTASHRNRYAFVKNMGNKYDWVMAVAPTMMMRTYRSHVIVIYYSFLNFNFITHKNNREIAVCCAECVEFYE